MTAKINPELIKILSKDNNLRPEAERILDRLSVPKDAPPTAAQKEFLQLCCKLLDSAVKFDDAIKQTLEKAKEKPDDEYVPSAIAIQQKPIDEARLKEITLRHSIDDDCIPEILEALKLKVGTLKEEHFGQFFEVCQQLQQNMDLPIVAQGVLNKAKAKPQSETESASAPTKNKIIASVVAASTESAIAKKRAHSGLAVQENAPSWRPSRDGKAIQLAEAEMKEAAKDIAQAASGAPFGGINDAVDYADRQIRAIRGEWTDAVFNEVENELNSDEMSIFLEKTYVGKRRRLSGN